MKKIFVNLKRFDVPRSMGGICPMDDPRKWVRWVIDESIKYGLGRLDAVEVTYLLPEALVITAKDKLADYSQDETGKISIGCQGVFRENIKTGGNFGAFTTNLPASAAKNLGCTWSIIGHSEERKDKLGIIARYDPSTLEDEKARKKAKAAVDSLINEEALCALDAGMNILLCIGETAEEKGGGSFDEQKPRIESVLKTQLETGLKGLECLSEKKSGLDQMEIVIGYEPIWAIGPGKTPPGAEYIGFVSAYIKSMVKQKFDFDPMVVYGGGLKEENAAMIAGIDTIGGGLVALTKFTGDIAFEPESLKKIITTAIDNR